MKYYIGIDVGTSSVKITLIDQDGNIICQSGNDHLIDQPRSGWKEIDPEIWFRVIDAAMPSLLGKIDREDVEGIGVTGQMHTTCYLDSSGYSIRPALMWNDVRTKELVPLIKEKISRCPEDAHIANIISTGSPALNLLWLKQNEPGHFSRIYKFLIGPDYIVHRLTGTWCTDYCEASTSSLYNLHTDSWSGAMREIMGFPESIYPEIKGSAQSAGTLLPEIADRWGLSSHVTVITGTGDNPAAALSTGCLSKGYPVLSLGTSGVLMFPREKAETDRKGKNIKFSTDGKNIRVLVQGVVQSAGNSLNWWVRQILDSQDFDKELKEINIEKLGQNPLLFYPHLVGDKTIYADASLRGAFIGLGTEVTREDMNLAVMEGIAFGVKELTEVMKLPKEMLSGLKVIGGGSKSPVWMQVLSDILEVPVEQAAGTLGAGYGIALLAGESCGGISDMGESAEKSMIIKQRFEPCPDHITGYRKNYARYKKIHDALKTIE